MAPTDVDTLVTIAPLIAAMLVAGAILAVDFVVPRRPAPALATAFIGLAIVAGLVAVAGQTPRAVFDGAYVVDALTTFLHLLFVAIIALTIAFAPGLPRGARPAGRRVRGGPRVRDVGRDADLRVGRPARPVPRPRAHGPARLSPRRLPQVGRLLDRGRDQVLPPRVVLQRDLPVRARVRLGPDRDDAHRGRGRRPRVDRLRLRGVLAGARHGPRVPDDRRRVQDRRGAVPLLDARRVPGLADAGDRLPLGGPQGRRVRAHHPAVRRGAGAARGRLERRGDRPRRDHDDAGQPRGAHPGQREADARVLLDRPHRLHAHGPRGVRGRRRDGSAAWRASSTTAPPTRS